MSIERKRWAEDLFESPVVNGDRETFQQCEAYSFVDKVFGSGSLVPRIDSALSSSTAPISIARYTATIGQYKSVISFSSSLHRTFLPCYSQLRHAGKNLDKTAWGRCVGRAFTIGTMIRMRISVRGWLACNELSFGDRVRNGNACSAISPGTHDRHTGELIREEMLQNE